MEFTKFVNGIGRLSEFDPQLCERFKNYLFPIIGCCIEVHREMGPFLNEYIYQEALQICFEENGYTGENCIKEYYFKTLFHEKELKHTHKVDFFINQNVLIECKAIDHIGPDQRQQLWNYMRLSGVKLGIIYNFAPIKDQYEKYYYCPEQKRIFMF